jgi:hypothetical protein
MSHLEEEDHNTLEQQTTYDSDMTMQGILSRPERAATAP